MKNVLKLKDLRLGGTERHFSNFNLRGTLWIAVLRYWKIFILF